MVMVSPLRDVGKVRSPEQLAGVRIERDGVAVERVVEDLAGIEDRAAVHPVAAGFAFRCRRRIRLELPLQRSARLGQIECKEYVRPWRRDIHRVVGDDGRSFLPAGDTRRRSRRP